MTVGSTYKIGTTSGNIAFLGVLTTPCDNPRGDSCRKAKVVCRRQAVDDYPALVSPSDGINNRACARNGWLPCQ